MRFNGHRACLSMISAQMRLPLVSYRSRCVPFWPQCMLLGIMRQLAATKAAFTLIPHGNYDSTRSSDIITQKIVSFEKRK